MINVNYHSVIVIDPSVLGNSYLEIVFVTASFTWNGLFSPFPCGIDLVVSSGISHEVFVPFRATNHESVVFSSGRCVLNIAWRRLLYSLSV